MFRSLSDVVVYIVMSKFGIDCCLLYNKLSNAYIKKHIENLQMKFPTALIAQFVKISFLIFSNIPFATFATFPLLFFSNGSLQPFLHAALENLNLRFP